MIAAIAGVPLDGARVTDSGIDFVTMRPDDSLDEAEPPDDPWEEFRDGDGDPLRIDGFRQLPLDQLPEDVSVFVWDDYFPELVVRREGQSYVCEIQEHIYAKYWEHKFSAHAFSEAMERAVLRLSQEGHPVSGPSRTDDDGHVFVRWHLRLPISTTAGAIVDSVKAAFDLVWQRAEVILEGSDSVLVLGKDTGEALERLTRIADRLRERGYYPYIIKEQRDKLGEGVIQKVMRYALSSKFVIVENTEASGHLYEIPHVAKVAECITVVLQEEGLGATWMFEDAYHKHRHWHKVVYRPGEVTSGVDAAIEWAETFVGEFAAHQVQVLPWLRGGA